MQFHERQYTNQLEDQLYAKAKVKNAANNSTDDDDDEEEPYVPPGGIPSAPKPTRKLDLGPLVKSVQDNENPISQSTAVLLGRLINTLYQGQQFYREALAKNPDVVNQIVNTLTTLKGKNLCNAPVSSLNDLIKMSFSSEDTRKLFGEMIEGGDSVPSLRDFILIRSKPTPIRMFGAPQALLMAIYNDANVVNRLMAERMELYNSIAAGRMKAQDASKQFKTDFGAEGLTDINPQLLNFDTSQTRPGK